MSRISVYKETGKGYERGWFTNCKCRYRCYKGARNTKKSYDMIGIEALVKILSHPLRNVLFLRATQSSQKFSTYSTMQMLIDKFDLNRFFKFNNSELIITYKPTGQLMLFKGFDDSQKLQSIRVPKGYLTDVYVEEAFEIDDYDAWRKFDGSIRGILPDDLFFQITFCFNAWVKEHWLYDKFFKGRLEDDFEYLDTHDYMDYMDEKWIGDFGRGLYLHISTYKINEFRDKDVYDEAMEELRNVAPEIYKVEALGMWGSSTGATYPEFSEVLVREPQEINNLKWGYYAIGIDTGYSDGQGKKRKDDTVGSATTMQLVGLTQDLQTLACIDEYFLTNEKRIKPLTMNEICEEMIDKIKYWIDLYWDVPYLMKGQILVYVDCADLGTRQNLEVVARARGLNDVRFIPSTKIKIDNRVRFIRLLMGYGQYLISKNCKNLIREIKASRVGEKGEARADGNDHSINANEYGWTPIVPRMKRWATFKQR